MYLDAQGAPKPVWVHSKESIFDDVYAGVGSANFNPRSLWYDGELTAFIRGQPALALRTGLWSEYWPGQVPLITEWRTEAEKHYNAFKGGNFAQLQNDRLYVVPLHWSDFSRAVPKPGGGRFEDIGGLARKAYGVLFVNASWY
jgi:phosphatidylserine/phosphatidylglycerophosphate/cardiolipin synthase-like enzyme